MAIEGNYRDDDQPPAPYVRAQVYLPDLRTGGEVGFLVDTGADATSLMPGDLGLMRVDLARVRGTYRTVGGVGGDARYKRTRAVLRFRDHDAFGHFQEFEIDIHLMADSEGLQLPSLLGRDILTECECTLDGVRERVAIRRLAGEG